jgi:hypothetical protein
MELRGETMAETVINVPAVGEPAWQGELTPGMLQEITGGLMIANQALSKRVAQDLIDLRAAQAARADFEEKRAATIADQLKAARAELKAVIEDPSAAFDNRIGRAMYFLDNAQLLLASEAAK